MATNTLATIDDRRAPTRSSGTTAVGFQYAEGMRDEPTKPRNSTAALDQLTELYRPVLSDLREEAQSTELVDRAEATSGARFQRGQQAAEHMLAAQGGVTSRQQALAAYASRQGAAANRDASVNRARLDQLDIRDVADKQLFNVEQNLATQEIRNVRHRENLEQQRELHNEQLRAQNKNSKRQFWGNIAGTAIGLGAAAMIM